MTTEYDDGRLGRARVSDTPELTAYYDELAQLEAGALWTVANDIEPWYPQPKSVPVRGVTARSGPWCARPSTWSRPMTRAAGWSCSSIPAART